MISKPLLDFPHAYELRGSILDLRTPIVMGVLNLTPDSFSDGGSYLSESDALKRVERMINEGASIVDIGGESTRPQAPRVSIEEEKRRIQAVVTLCVERFPETFFSIDTTKYDIAKFALDHGFHIVNDVTGLQGDISLAALSKEYDAALVLMHSKGNPQTMQVNPTYDDVVAEIKAFFFHQLQIAENIEHPKVILDVGFGFGKTLEHNLILAARLAEFTSFPYPILVGASRKSMIGTLLNERPVDDRLIGTVAFHYDSMINGAKILRVHDVKEAIDSILVYNSISAFR